jgi:ankyrin repeat protein
VAAAVAKGCEVNETDQEGNSCLHIAVASGSNEILQILLRSGADVAAKNKKGNTAVELAQNAQTIEFLKAAGATMPEIPDKDKNKRLHAYATKGLTGGVLLALKAGADVNHRGKETANRTPLHLASANNHHATAQLLVKHGAQVNAQDVFKQTPLHYAVLNNHHTTAQLLVEHGAQVNASFNFGGTLVAFAQENGYRETEALLRQHGGQ